MYMHSMIQISAFMTHSNLHDAGKKEKENEKKYWTQYHETQTEDNKIKSISQLWKKNHVCAGSNIQVLQMCSHIGPNSYAEKRRKAPH